MNEKPDVIMNEAEGEPEDEAEFFDPVQRPFDNPIHFFLDLEVLARRHRLLAWVFRRLQHSPEADAEVAHLFMHYVERDVSELSRAIPAAKDLALPNQRARREFEHYRKALPHSLRKHGFSPGQIEDICRRLEVGAAAWADNFAPRAAA